MLDPERIRKISKANEAIVEKRFKMLGYSVKPLDVQGPRKRPEFLIERGGKKFLVCEVKTIFSGGYLPGPGVHLSTEDSGMLLPASDSDRSDQAGLGKEIDFANMEDDLGNAVLKYKTLVEDMPKFAGIPYAVAFFVDFFADNWDLFPAAMPKFQEVSGILRIVKDKGIRDAAQKMDFEELEERVKTGSMKGLPPNSKGFEVIENSCAHVRLPREFLNSCCVRQIRLLADRSGRHAR